MNRKRALSLLFPKYSRRLDMVNYNALLGEWIREHSPIRAYEISRDLYRYLNDEIFENAAIDFLEFGVFRGESLQYWTEFNTHPDSRFVGFDSFEGLPEDWKLGLSTLKKGHFSTNGQLPGIDDPRVSFVKGWFQDTVNGFLETYKPNNRMVLHIDCDLYSASMYCLTKFDSLLRSGSVILFDDFSGPVDIFRSFHDYVHSYWRQYRVLAARHPYYKELAVEIAD